MSKGDWISFNNLIINPDSISKIQKSADKIRIDFSDGRFIDFAGEHSVTVIWDYFLEYCGDSFTTDGDLDFKTVSR